MRILHVVDSLDPRAGGPPAVALNLAASMRRLGHEVSVLGHCAPDRWPLVADMVQSLGAACEPDVVAVSDRGAIERFLSWRVLRALMRRRRRYDVCHVHGVWRASLIWATILFPGSSRVVTPHGMVSGYGLGQRPLRKRLALLAFWRQALRRAALVQALSMHEAADLRRFIGPRRTVIVPNGINFEEYSGTVDRDEFHRLHPELARRPYVLFLGRLDRMKGPDLLVDAFAEVAGRVADACLVIVGPDYGCEGAIRRSVREAGLEDRIFVLGPLYGAEKRAALAGAVCLCQPSRYEGFALSIVEALASAVPVVISTECGMDHELVNAGAGQIVPLEVPRIAAAVEHYLRDAPAQRAAAAAAQRFAHSRYSWHTIAATLVGHYQEAVLPPAGTARTHQAARGGGTSGNASR